MACSEEDHTYGCTMRCFEDLRPWLTKMAPKLLREDWIELAFSDGGMVCDGSANLSIGKITEEQVRGFLAYRLEVVADLSDELYEALQSEHGWTILTCAELMRLKMVEAIPEASGSFSRYVLTEYGAEIGTYARNQREGRVA